eukprot:Skav226877  [mRNA]  locus=scaffold1187:232013:233249:+ [translate_table: standard]
MVSLRLLFAFFVLPLAHEEDTSFVEVNQAQEEISGGWNENPVVNQAQEEISGGWNENPVVNQAPEEFSSGWNENPVVNQAQEEISGGWNENPVVNQAQQEMSGGWNENPVVNQAQQEMSGGWNENPVVNQAQQEMKCPEAGTRILAFFVLPLAHEEDTSFVEVNQAQEEISGGWNENPVVNQAQEEISGGWNENPVVTQAEEKRSSAWKAMKNGVIKNTLKQAETRATEAWNMAQNNTFLKPITEDMSHMWAELSNSTPVTIPHAVDRQMYPWNIGAVVVAALLVLLPMGCCAKCASIHYENFSQHKTSYHLLLPEVNGDLRKVLQREVLVMLACPALALMAGPWTTCADGCPNFIYVLYLPILFRSKFVEYQLMLNFA